MLVLLRWRLLGGTGHSYGARAGLGDGFKHPLGVVERYAVPLVWWVAEKGVAIGHDTGVAVGLRDDNSAVFLLGQLAPRFNAYLQRNHDALPQTVVSQAGHGHEETLSLLVQEERLCGVWSQRLV